MKIALLGFGTVGKGFYALVKNNTELEVSTVLSRRPRAELNCTVTSDFDEIVRDPSIDIVVEVMGGLEPAYTYICAAMRAEKHVLTANKQLMCAHYDELLALAKDCGVCLRCTAAAGGGIPWLSSLARASELDRITAVEGILNGTTNYILSAMSASPVSYTTCLAEAQELGYAEADPTADVEGYDARRKIALSANIAFGVSVQEEAIPCVGISSISAEDIEKATKAGFIFKLIARAERNGDGVCAYVCPTLFPTSNLLRHINGTDNCITLYAEHFGAQSFSGIGAGGYATGSNILRDALDILHGCTSFYVDRAEPCDIDTDGAEYSWFFRCNGEYITHRCSVKTAFETYNLYRKDDPGALMARFAIDME